MIKVVNSWAFKGPFIVSAVGTICLIPTFLITFSEGGILSVQNILQNSFLLSFVSAVLSGYALGITGLFFYTMDRLPKKDEYWGQLESLFRNQKINDTSLDGLLNFSLLVIEQMKLLDKYIDTLKGPPRERAVLEVVRAISKNEFTHQDLRKSPRVAFIIDSFVEAMTKLAEEHPNKTEILELVEKFKRQEAEGSYSRKAA
jgi:hypothetical protein